MSSSFLQANPDHEDHDDAIPSSSSAIKTTLAAVPPPPGAPTKRTTTAVRSLEETFELLEARFTQPLLLLGHNHHHHHHHNNHNNGSSSTGHSNLSEHSIGFPGATAAAGTGTTSRGSHQQHDHHGHSPTSLSPSSWSAPGSGGGGGDAETPPPPSSTTDDRNWKPSTQRRLSLGPHTPAAAPAVKNYNHNDNVKTFLPSSPPSLEVVAQAATRHLRKIAGIGGGTGGSGNGEMNNDSSRSKHSNNNSNSSQHTLLVGNHQRKVIVAESPPTTTTTALVTPHNGGGVTGGKEIQHGKHKLDPQHEQQQPQPHQDVAGSNEPNKADDKNKNSRTPSSLLLVNTNNNNNNNDKPKVTRSLLPPSAIAAAVAAAASGKHSLASKRKSAPKRKVSTIQDRLLVDDVEDGEEETPTVAAAAPAAAATTPPPKKGRTTNSNSNHNSNSRSPHHPFFSSHSNQRNNSDSRSNTGGGGNGNGNSSNGLFGGGGGGGGSRKVGTQRGGSGTTTTTIAPSSSSTSGPPANNKLIHDFFSAVAKKKSGSGTVGTKLGSGINTSSGSSSTNTTAQAGKKKAPAPTPTTTAAATSNAAAVNEELQAQCEKLQQQLQDKEEQLRAVTNNRTIKHTALQSALSKAKEEMEDLQEASERRAGRYVNVLEDLLREKALKAAKDVRSALAADGARLGRLTYVRAGMRVLDSWEEGYATQDLQRRKDELQRKKKVLLERQKELKKRLKGQPPLDANKNNKSDDREDESTSSNLTADAPMTLLELQEARESIQMHLEAVKRDEQELLAEEIALNQEKAAHTRALKLVAAEDASRFSSRPKLHDRYVLDRLLGKGGFSEVWKAYDLEELREAAVKIHQLDPRWPDSKKENYVKHVSREYDIHCKVRHPRIVSFYDVFEIDEDSFATVLEVCSGTDLDTLLKQKKRLSEKHARAILLQILSGMQYLSQPSGERQGIIHYDLKPGNILFDEFGDAKITDFGLSKIVDAPDPAESMELTSQGAGTYWYLPPECFVIDEHVRISNKVDVWSIGVIFYQMLFGRRPFGEGKSQDRILADQTMLNAEEVPFPDRPVVSDGCKEFLKQCLMYDQAFRPTIAQLCENPYVLQQQSTTTQPKQQQSK